MTPEQEHFTDTTDAQWHQKETEQREKSMNQSEQINELAAALSKAQGDITGAKKESENPFFQSKYADLAACWDACREPLSNNGLAVIQTTRANGDGIVVVTTLAHQSGQWISGELKMTPDKDTPQGYGSCLTYARRYALAAMVGLAQVDDDAESATARISPQKRTKIINAMKAAVQAEDGPGLLEVVDELDQDEHKAVWNVLRSDERAAIKALLQTAREAANQADPRFASTESKPSEKDQRRAGVSK